MIETVAIPERRLKGLKNKRNLVKKLENLSGANIRIDDRVEIESEDSLSVLRVRNVIKAYGRGFKFSDALFLLDENYQLSIIDLKDFARSPKRMKILRGRVIGSEGKTKKLIERMANVKMAISGKTVCIIGNWADIEFARRAVCMILEGSKHGTVYRYLEENLKKEKP